MGKANRIKEIKKSELRLDFGCGPNPREGFEGVDILPFDGKVKHVLDLSKSIEGNVTGTPEYGKRIFLQWPWEDNSVVEAHASHFVEHLDANERCHFVNELFRILVPGGTCQIIVPHWASNRAYGDPTHKWPPVSEMWFYYLKQDWRNTQAPHTDIKYNPNGFSCNFEATWGYSLRPDLAVRSQEYQQTAIQNYKEVCLDMIATLKKY